MANLHGLRIVNTRPEARAHGLSDALQHQGATVLALPLLEVEAMPLSPTAKQYLLDLDRYDMVFVVSPTAAELGLKALADYWPQWPVDVAWLAVGESTAQVLHSYLINPIVPQQESSEGLLQLPQLQQLEQGQRLLVLRGEGGRNLVRDTMQAQGVQVDYINLYRRQLPAIAHNTWQALQADSIDIVIITSGETLTQWLNIAAQQAQKIPILVISSRLADLATQKGIKTVLISASIKPTDIILTLSLWQNRQEHVID
ncbi:MAG TPA: uroporphyrinogen-III synthase [Agitococcus sp.]|nr:uroporphyrinogen-III synthase [Agitococcus sp.]